MTARTAGGGGWPRGHAYGPRSRRRRGPRAARLGGAGDPRADRGVGSGGPVAPQARASRQLSRQGVRVALHGAAGGAETSRRAAGRAVPPTAAKAAVSQDCLGKEPDLDLGRLALPAGQAGRLRDRRRRPPLLDGYLLTTEQTHTQVQLLFARALEDQGLLGPDGLPLAAGDHNEPILVAWSDNGAEMTAIDTKQFMALMAIAQHHGRPGTPTDQAHVESFFSHLKGEWPLISTIRDPDVLDQTLHHIRTQYNTVRLHAAIGYVTPTTSTTAAD